MTEKGNNPAPPRTGRPRRAVPIVLDCGICGQHAMRFRKRVTGPEGESLAPVLVCWFCDAATRTDTMRAA